MPLYILLRNRPMNLVRILYLWLFWCPWTQDFIGQISIFMWNKLVWKIIIFFKLMILGIFKSTSINLKLFIIFIIFKKNLFLGTFSNFFFFICQIFLLHHFTHNLKKTIFYRKRIKNALVSMNSVWMQCPVLLPQR